MPETCCIKLNGLFREVTAGTTVAAAMLLSGQPLRVSVSGEARSALCGMGTCFECRATVDGVLHQRTCKTLCVDGMSVETSR